MHPPPPNPPPAQFILQVNSLHCLLGGIVPTPRKRREHALIRFCRTLTHKQKILISSAAASIVVYTDQRTFWVQRGCACDRLLLYKLATWGTDRLLWGREGRGQPRWAGSEPGAPPPSEDCRPSREGGTETDPGCCSHEHCSRNDYGAKGGRGPSWWRGGLSAP